MSVTTNYLAFDLGASSGRAMLGRFDGQRLTLEELHRFANGPVNVRGGLYWDAFRLLDEIKTGLRCCTRSKVALDGIGIDTWGVDFGLLAPGGELLAMPRHYRDPRHAITMEQVLERVPRARIYETTGIQHISINTLYQLCAAANDSARLLDAAERLLFMPDLFAFWLTGVARTERTIASTSQIMDARRGDWDRELLAELELPAGIMPSIGATGTVVGELLPEVRDEVGQADTVLIATASHDTAAAVAAVPATGSNWAYISSGTWSLVGVELPEPLITAETLAANFTNEAGVAGTTRFLRNVTGLWLVQECQRHWAGQGQQYTHEELARLAGEAPPLASFVNPDDPRFAEPGDMPGRMRRACEETGQSPLGTPGHIVRCALESLALTYRRVLDAIEQLTGRRVEVVHIVGGGVRNDALNQFTANATGRPVLAGPAEATAAGNVMVQAWAQQHVGSLDELRQMIADSSTLKRYEPRDTAAWDEANERFRALWDL